MFTVLLPLDSNEDRAIAAANAVTTIPGSRENVEVTVLNVQEEIEVRSDSVVKSEEWYDEEKYPESIGKALAVLEDAGITVKKRREHADPAEAIVEMARDIDADRIVMAGRKRSPTGKLLFGSVVQSVLLATDVPVTVVMTE